MNADKNRSFGRREIVLAVAFIALFIGGYLLLSWPESPKRTDIRSLVPADALVYLETNDLGAALQPIVDSKPFNEVAKKKPDLSPLKGVQLAIAITGFETSEEKVNEEQSVGKIQPHFVAIADTHAWQFQTVRFAEQKLGSFVADIYDSEPTLEEHEKGGGHYLTWTAKDGRKAYAFVNRNLIYFGNDESSIDKCLAVARGEADSIAKGGKVGASEPGTLASGYVSTDGVAQIANIFALKFAQDASEEPEVQSAIAGMLPQILRNTITDVTWTATKTNQGYEDKWQIGMPPPVVNSLGGPMSVGGQVDIEVEKQIPQDGTSATLYNFADPQAAWKSLLSVAQSQTDPRGAQMITEFSAALAEPYGIRDPISFLALVSKNSSGKYIFTAHTGEGDGDPLLVAPKTDEVETVKTLMPGLIHSSTDASGVFWSTPDGETKVRFGTTTLKLGSTNNVGTWDQTSLSNQSPFDRLTKSEAPIATAGRDSSTTLQIVEMLAHEANGDTQAWSTYFTETHFTKSGIERTTTSDFGFIGWVIAQLAEE